MSEPIKQGEFPEEFRELKKLLGVFESRASDDLCLLCQSNVSAKKNSHIIPDFFSKSIFKDLAKRKLLVSDGIKSVPKPSAPKEDYILCPICEERIGALERLVSIVLPPFLQNVRDKISPIVLEGEFGIDGINIEPPLFHLFVYSMLWRASVSNMREFSGLVLSKDHEEELRSTLDECLSTSRAEMITKMEARYPDNLPLYYQAFSFHESVDKILHNIQGKGADYNGDGYKLFANEFFFGFRASLEANWKRAGKRGAQDFGFITFVPAAKWEELVLSTRAHSMYINSLLKGATVSPDTNKNLDGDKRQDIT